MSPKQKNSAKRGGPKMFYMILAAVAVLGIAAIAWSAMSSRASAMATEPIDLSTVADAQSLLEKAQGVPVGSADAPVKLLVFSDYMCPACKHWASFVEPAIKSSYVESGQVQIVYYDFPLSPGHRHSFLAARAARCAGDQNKFWEYHDALFGAQQDWSYDQGAPTGKFIQYAEDAGLAEPQFTQCLESDQHAELVSANKMLGEQLGVRGTPTVFLNGRQVNEWQQFETVKPLIDGALGQ